MNQIKDEVHLLIGDTVDFVAKILRLGLSFESISSNVSGRVVDFTANARRFVGGDDKSSFGAMACG